MGHPLSSAFRLAVILSLAFLLYCCCCWCRCKRRDHKVDARIDKQPNVHVDECIKLKEEIPVGQQVPVRVDYYVQLESDFYIGGWSMLWANREYWTNWDVSAFILNRLRFARGVLNKNDGISTSLASSDVP